MYYCRSLQRQEGTSDSTSLNLTHRKFQQTDVVLRWMPERFSRLKEFVAGLELEEIGWQAFCACMQHPRNGNKNELNRAHNVERITSTRLPHTLNLRIGNFIGVPSKNTFLSLILPLFRNIHFTTYLTRTKRNTNRKLFSGTDYRI